jgi:putative sporulation protein YyaC
MLNYSNIEENNMQNELKKELNTLLKNEKKLNNYSKIIIICIGTDKITGDCFGPLVGTKLINMLEKYNFYNINIYGSLEKNINYTNVQQLINNINNEHTNSCKIVIDSALSKKENIGKLFITNKKVSLGSGLKKEKLEIGDISITAVVGKDYQIPKYNFKALQNISLNVVMNLADIVANGIYETIKTQEV